MACVHVYWFSRAEKPSRSSPWALSEGRNEVDQANYADKSAALMKMWRYPLQELLNERSYASPFAV